MDENELREKMAQHGLNLVTLCAYVTQQTGAIINHKHVQTTFSRSPCLSEPMTGLFRFAFLKLERDEGHVRA